MPKKYFLLLVSFLIVGCVTKTVTPAQTETDTNEATPCPTKVLQTIYPSKYSPMLIYVLVEGTQSYRDLITRSIEIMGKILPDIIEPKDRIIETNMEDYDKKRARIFNGEVENVEFPNYSYSPLETPHPATIVHLPTLQGSYGKFVQETAVRATKDEYNRMLTKASNDQYCVQIQEEINNKKLFDEWEISRKNFINIFVTNYVNTTSKIDLSGLPENSNPTAAISQASEIFKLFCSPDSFQKCYLIIFSNLTGLISVNPQIQGIDLKGIGVIAVLQKCTFLSDCSKTVTRWTDYFTSAGASSIHFIPNGDEVELLKKYLVR